jgi:hypothetical protein
MAQLSLFLLIIAIAIVLGWRYAVRRGRQAALLVSRGTPVTGTVIDTRKVRRSRTHQSCKVRYAFDTTGGVRYEREIEVMPKEFGNYRKGQEIDIVYDPADPDNNMLSSMVTQAREALDRHRTPIAGE